MYQPILSGSTLNCISLYGKKYRSVGFLYIWKRLYKCWIHFAWQKKLFVLLSKSVSISCERRILYKLQSRENVVWNPFWGIFLRRHLRILWSNELVGELPQSKMDQSWERESGKRSGRECEGRGSASSGREQEEVWESVGNRKECDGVLKVWES